MADYENRYRRDRSRTQYRPAEDDRFRSEDRDYGQDFGYENYNRRDFRRDRDFSGYRGAEDYRDFQGRTYEGPYGREGGAMGRGYMGRTEQDYGQRGRDWQREDRGFFSRAGDEIASWFGNDEAERRREQDRIAQHRGRGPRNYVRSDARIQDDVNDRLTDNPVLDASDIEVIVSNGEVTLTGLVASRFDKRLAEDIVESISGVKHVQNNLRVRDVVETDQGAIPGFRNRGIE